MSQGFSKHCPSADARSRIDPPAIGLPEADHTHTSRPQGSTSTTADAGASSATIRSSRSRVCATSAPGPLGSHTSAINCHSEQTRRTAIPRRSSSSRNSLVTESGTAISPTRRSAPVPAGTDDIGSTVLNPADVAWPSRSSACA